MSRRPIRIGFFVLLAVVASACTGSVDISFGGRTPVQIAVELIEDQAMAQRLGVGPITDAVCEEPLNQEVGTIFECSGQSQGQTINFDVLFEEDDRIFAGPTNVVNSDGVERLETVAVRNLNTDNDFALPTDALECGDGAVILDADQQMVCALTDPDTGTVFDALVTVTDTDAGEFSIVIVGEAS